jgi:hypothetical protein
MCPYPLDHQFLGTEVDQGPQRRQICLICARNHLLLAHGKCQHLGAFRVCRTSTWRGREIVCRIPSGFSAYRVELGDVFLPISRHKIVRTVSLFL